MTNILEEVRNLLLPLGFNVFQEFPKKYNSFPAITIRELETMTRTDLSNNRTTENTVIELSIWAKKTSEITAIYNDLEAIMRTNDYSLRFTGTMMDDSGLNRRVIRFSKIF